MGLGIEEWGYSPIKYKRLRVDAISRKKRGD